MAIVAAEEVLRVLYGKEPKYPTNPEVKCVLKEGR